MKGKILLIALLVLLLLPSAFSAFNDICDYDRHSSGYNTSSSDITLNAFQVGGGEFTIRLKNETGGSIQILSVSGERFLIVQEPLSEVATGAIFETTGTYQEEYHYNITKPSYFEEEIKWNYLDSEGKQKEVKLTCFVNTYQGPSFLFLGFIASIIGVPLGIALTLYSHIKRKGKIKSLGLIILTLSIISLLFFFIFLSSI